MMFSVNGKISARQAGWLLTMEWLVKLCLLFPAYLSGKSVGTILFCTAAGAGLSLLAVKLQSWKYLRQGKDFFGAVSGILGHPTAVIFYAAGFLYFFTNAAVFLNLTAELVRHYLLPELSIPMLLLPFAATAFLLCIAGIETRGRFCEVTGPIVMALLGILAATSLWNLSPVTGVTLHIGRWDLLSCGIYDVFACTDLLLAPLLLASCVEPGTETSTSLEQAVRSAALRSIALAGVLCAVTAASYGSGAMRQFSFPMVRMMGNAATPGGIMRRWEVFFLMLLLIGLTVTVGGSFWYMREISGRLQAEIAAERAGAVWRCGNDKEEPQKSGISHMEKAFAAECTGSTGGSWVWLAGILAACLAAGGFLNEVCSLGYYRALNLYCLMPLFFLMTAAAHGQRYRRRTAAAVGMLLVFALLLTGCTAREPEDRLFPMALEFDVQEGQLQMTCAWNEGSGPGSKQEPGENKGEKETEGTGKSKSTLEPNLMTLTGSSLSEIEQTLLDYTEQYVDYSHVKSIIINERLGAFPELEREVVEWMSRQPEFATGLVLYPAQQTGLTLAKVQEQSAGKVGSYLENLYRNNERYRSASFTLGEWLGAYYKEEKV